MSGGSVTDRPLISWIFSDEASLEAYHTVMNQFVSEVIESGWLAEEITRVAALLRPEVEADENSFYTVDEFDAAVETLQRFCSLRGESIRGQLDGSIPSTTSGQQTDSASLVDASELSLTVMGSMNRGGGSDSSGGGFSGGFPSRPGSDGGSQQTPDFSSTTPTGNGSSDSSDSASSDSGASQNGFPDFSGGFPSRPGSDGGSQQTPDYSTTTPTGNGSSDSSDSASPPQSGFSRPADGFNPDVSAQGSRMSWTELALWAGVLLLAIALVSRLRGQSA